MTIFVADEQESAVDVADLHRMANAVLRAEGCPRATEVSVILVGDDEMAVYNQRYLDRDGPTDVVSLPIEDLRPGVPPGHGSDGPPPMLGDVILAPGYIRRQAEQLDRQFDDELGLMLVHGILHLLGYQHEAEPDTSRMERREAEIMATLGRAPR